MRIFENSFQKSTVPESIDCTVDRLDQADVGTWPSVPDLQIDQRGDKICREQTAGNLPLWLPWQWEECHVW